jgi:hypothetical protein
VTAVLKEASLLPVAVRDSHVESALIDILIQDSDCKTISTIQDGELAIPSKLKGLKVEVKASAILTGALRRIVVPLVFWNTSKAIPKDSQLAELLKAKLKLDDNIPLIQMYTDVKDKTRSLVVRVPICNDEEGQKALFHIIDAMCALHCVKGENVKFHGDTSLGSGEFRLPSKVQKLCKQIAVIARDPEGSFPSATVEKTTTGASVDLISAMALCHLLSKRQEVLRKRLFKKPTVKATSYESLVRKVRDALTLEGLDPKSYIAKAIRAMFMSCIKVTNTGFPGGFIKHSKNINAVKTSEALLHKIGWIPMYPSINKVRQVVLHDVKQKFSEDKKKVVQNDLFSLRKDKKKTNLRVFRVVEAMVLPLIDETLDVPIQEQIKKGGTITPETIKAFNDPRRAKLLDLINDAYTFLISTENKKSKTRAIHFKIARDLCLNHALNHKYISAHGTQWSKWADVPKKIRDYLESEFCRDRAVPTTSTNETTSEHVESVQSDVEMTTTAEQSDPKRKDSEESSSRPKRQKRVKKT